MNMNNTNQYIANALATCMHIMHIMHVMHCLVNATTGTSPGVLVYNKDMIMDIPLITNLVTIRDRNQHLIDKNLIR